MQKLLVGLIVGIVVGVLFGVSVVTPRLQPDATGGPVMGQGPDGATTPLAMATGSESPERELRFVTTLSADLSVVRQLPEQLEHLGHGLVFRDAAAEIMDAVQSGTLDGAIMATQGLQGLEGLSSRVPALALFGSAPFGPPPMELLAWLYTGGGEALLQRVAGNKGLSILPCGMNPVKSAGWFRNRISAAEDLRGLSMATSGLGAMVLEKTGVNPVTLSPEEILTAFRTGTIDAAETLSLSGDLQNHMPEVAGYYYFPAWHQRSALIHLVMALEVWEGLEEHTREALRSLCAANTQRDLTPDMTRQFEALKVISGERVEVLKLPQPVLAELRKAWQRVLHAEMERDSDFAEVWRALNDFRRDYAIWRELGAL